METESDCVASTLASSSFGIPSNCLPVMHISMAVALQLFAEILTDETPVK